MKKVVYKYDIGKPYPKIPLSARVLHIGLQHGKPMIWCEHDWPVEKTKEWSKIFIVPTGSEFDADGLLYLGSLLMLNDSFVVHVYRARKSLA